jgi:hypothetical protein
LFPCYILCQIHLEKHFNWKGVGIDIVSNLAREYNLNRTNDSFVANGILPFGGFPGTDSFKYE